MVKFGYHVPLLLLCRINELSFSATICARNMAKLHIVFKGWRRSICILQHGGVFLQHNCKFPCVREFALQ
jgi:hypothetical protein